MTSLFDPLAKKRGRPLGSTNKRKRKPAKKMQVGDTATFKQLNAEASRVAKKERELNLLKEHAQLLLDQSRLNAKIVNLEHQAIGYRAVISYLEHQFITTLGNK
jgi:tRNA A37 N6-isopentenylltransferase MiaA